MNHSGTGRIWERKGLLTMLAKTQKTAFYTMLLGVLVALSAEAVVAQEHQTTVRPRRVSQATSVRTIPSGEKVTITGNVTKAGEGSFSACDMAGAETVVQFSNATRITTHRRGVFRGPLTHDKSALIIGLTATIKGQRSESAELVAKCVGFDESADHASTPVAA